MSYWISLEGDLGGAIPIKIGSLEVNYTSNLYDFFKWFLDKPLCEFDKGEAWDFCEAITNGFRKIRNENVSLEELAKYNPENGWGQVSTAMAVLVECAVACTQAPHAKVRVSS